MSPASQWRLGVSGAISYDHFARRGIDRRSAVNVAAIISRGGEKRGERGVVSECVTCLKKAPLK